MSVFTPITLTELHAFLEHYSLGEVIDFGGITGGTHNTNYWLDMSSGHYIVTLFEDFTATELAPVISLINYFAAAGLPFARIIPNQDAVCLAQLKHKPAVIAECLTGEHPEQLSLSQLTELGTQLGRMHRLGQTQKLERENFRNFAWVCETAYAVHSKLNLPQQTLMNNELALQDQQDWTNLPKGIIHADLFRDNLLIENNKLTGIIDAYNLCHDYLLLDVAIAVNDCCQNQHGMVDKDKAARLLNAYALERVLTPQEIIAWPVMLRFAALTFWVLRLRGSILLPDSPQVFKKDPLEYQRILEG